EVFKDMLIKATRDDEKKAGNFVSAIKYLARRLLDTYKPCLPNGTSEYESLLVDSVKYLCQLHGFEAFPELTRKDLHIPQVLK
ncbi:hypothetical protein CHS0354_031143, partial [Potamilus streckersoni]